MSQYVNQVDGRLSAAWQPDSKMYAMHNGFVFSTLNSAIGFVRFDFCSELDFCIRLSDAWEEHDLLHTTPEQTKPQ